MIRAVSLAILLVAVVLPARAQFTSESTGGGGGGSGFSGASGGSGSSVGGGLLSSGGGSSYNGQAFSVPSVADPVRPAPYRQAIPPATMKEPITDPAQARSPRF